LGKTETNRNFSWKCAPPTEEWFLLGGAREFNSNWSKHKTSSLAFVL
jgi:hypothetical protein